MSSASDPISIEAPAAGKAGVALPPPAHSSARTRVRNAREWVIQSLLFLAAFSAVLITTGIVVLLLYETTRFFYRFGEVAIVPPAEVRSVEKAIDKQRQAIEEFLGESGGAKPEVLTRPWPGGGTYIVVHTAKADFEGVKTRLAGKGFAVDSGASAIRPNLSEFLTSRTWSPEFGDPQYGILPLLGGTLMTTAIALLVALPLGTVAATYLSEYAAHSVRETLKPILELLSAVPTVVYGYFAVQFVTPLFKGQILPGFAPFPDLGTYNMLSAGLVMGIMIIPYVSSLSEDAMRAVPMSLREGSYAMGATKMQTAFRVVVPASFSGITAAYILGISRAIGETMVVALAAGNLRSLTANPTQETQTITAYIVQVAGGDLEHGSIAYQSIFAAGLMLFVLTLLFNIGGYYLRKRYREAY